MFGNKLVMPKLNRFLNGINKLWRQMKNNRKINYCVRSTVVAILIVSTSSCGILLEKPVPNVKTITYSSFIQELKQGDVENVGLSADRSRALVQTKDGNKATVNLPPNDDRLVKMLNENVKGNIYVLPQNDDGPWFRILSSLFFPILLMIGLPSLLLGLLFLLIRTREDSGKHK